MTTAAAALRLGGTARTLANWDTGALDRPEGGTLEITAVPARHGPEGCKSLTGDVTGFIVSGVGLPTVYVSGDNASLDIVRDIAERLATIDVALLFAGAARTSLQDGAPLTLTSADAAAAAQILDARWIVPLHVRGWTHFSEGPGDVQAAFAATPHRPEAQHRPWPERHLLTTDPTCPPTPPAWGRRTSHAHRVAGLRRSSRAADSTSLLASEGDYPRQAVLAPAHL